MLLYNIFDNHCSGAMHCTATSIRMTLCCPLSIVNFEKKSYNRKSKIVNKFYLCFSKIISR